MDTQNGDGSSRRRKSKPVHLDTLIDTAISKNLSPQDPLDLIVSAFCADVQNQRQDRYEKLANPNLRLRNTKKGYPPEEFFRGTVFEDMFLGRKKQAERKLVDPKFDHYYDQMFGPDIDTADAADVFEKPIDPTGDIVGKIVVETETVDVEDLVPTEEEDNAPIKDVTMETGAAVIDFESEGDDDTIAPAIKIIGVHSLKPVDDFVIEGLQTIKEEDTGKVGSAMAYLKEAGISEDEVFVGLKTGQSGKEVEVKRLVDLGPRKARSVFNVKTWLMTLPEGADYLKLGTGEDHSSAAEGSDEQMETSKSDRSTSDELATSDDDDCCIVGEAPAYNYLPAVSRPLQPDVCHSPKVFEVAASSSTTSSYPEEVSSVKENFPQMKYEEENRQVLVNIHTTPYKQQKEEEVICLSSDSEVEFVGTGEEVITIDSD